MSPPARLLTLLLTGYQRFISPLLGPRCRFYPSCSTYAMEAVQVHGAARGCLLAAVRLAKCHPFHPGGLDPVPPRRPAGPAAQGARPAAAATGPQTTTAGQTRPRTPADRAAAETVREQAGG